MAYARDHLPEKLAAEIDGGNLEEVESIYDSEQNESMQPALLEGIAERAIGKSQSGIIDWVFSSKGFRVASDSLNNEVYHQACFAHSLDVWKALVRNGFDFDAHHSEFFGERAEPGGVPRQRRHCPLRLGERAGPQQGMGLR